MPSPNSRNVQQQQRTRMFPQVNLNVAVNNNSSHNAPTEVNPIRTFEIPHRRPTPYSIPRRIPFSTRVTETFWQEGDPRRTQISPPIIENLASWRTIDSSSVFSGNPEGNHRLSNLPLHGQSPMNLATNHDPECNPLPNTSRPSRRHVGSRNIDISPPDHDGQRNDFLRTSIPSPIHSSSITPLNSIRPSVERAANRTYSAGESNLIPMSRHPAASQNYVAQEEDDSSQHHSAFLHHLNNATTTPSRTHSPTVNQNIMTTPHLPSRGNAYHQRYQIDSHAVRNTHQAYWIQLPMFVTTVPTFFANTIPYSITETSVRNFIEDDDGFYDLEGSYGSSESETNVPQVQRDSNEWRRLSNLLVEVPATENDLCTICIDEHSKETQWKLPCSHKFHHDCIMPWLVKNPTCPICRN